MATVKFVHFGAGEPEIGIQFDADDGAGGTVVGRVFALADPALKKAVIDAAQAALDAMTGELPADYQPGAVTTALMRKRNAEQEAKKAADRKLAADKSAEEAEAKRQAAAEAMTMAESLRAQALADVDAALAKKAALDAEIAAAEAAKKAAETPADPT